MGKFEFNWLSIVFLAFLAGLAYLVLNFLSGQIAGIGDLLWGGLGSIIVSVSLVAGLLFLRNFVNIDDLDFVSFIILLVAISIFGSVVTLFLPFLSPFILSTSNVFASVNSLLLLLTSLVIGQFVGKRLSDSLNFGVM